LFTSNGRSRYDWTHLEKNAFDRLRGGPDDDRLLQLLAARVSDHRQLGAEALDVLGLAPQVRLRDEQREVGVLRASGLDPVVHLALHPLPQRVPGRPDHHGAADRPVVGQLRLGDDVLVPAGEVLGLGRENGSLGHERR